MAGSILYAIPLAMGFQIGIVALLVGWMVGKAIRNGSYGVGGRPQQILAVVLTYFAISTSFFPAAGLHRRETWSGEPKSAAGNPDATIRAPVIQSAKPKISGAPGKAIGRSSSIHRR